MNILVLSASQALYDLDFYKDILRKTARRYPDLIVRTDGGNKHARELTEFARALGWRVEVWAVNAKWHKYNSEIRNAQMLTGYVLNPQDLSIERTEPCADLLLAFQGTSQSDNTKDLTKWALANGFRLHLYREKWTKKKKYKEAIFKGIVHITNHERKPFALSTESWVYKPSTERIAA